MPQIAREEGRRVFGVDPAGYDRGRPGHPDRVYQVLVGRCGLAPGARVLEIGPGTGQATCRLLELGADVVAVEPNSALADYVTATDASIVVWNQPLEEAELPADAFDLAVAASSFHWVDEDLGLSKIFDALRPGGWVGLWWTLFGDDVRPDAFQQEVGCALDEIFARDGVELETSPSAGAEGGPRFGLDVEARRTALVRAGFDRFRHEVVAWANTWDAVGIRRLYGSFSPVLRLPPDTRSAVLDAVTQVAAEKFGGRVQRPLRTSLYTARRPGA